MYNAQSLISNDAEVKYSLFSNTQNCFSVNLCADQIGHTSFIPVKQFVTSVYCPIYNAKYTRCESCYLACYTFEVHNQLELINYLFCKI